MRTARIGHWSFKANESVMWQLCMPCRALWSLTITQACGAVMICIQITRVHARCRRDRRQQRGGTGAGEASRASGSSSACTADNPRGAAAAVSHHGLHSGAGAHLQLHRAHLQACPPICVRTAALQANFKICICLVCELLVLSKTPANTSIVVRVQAAG